MKVTTLPFVAGLQLSLEQNKQGVAPDFGAGPENGAAKDFASDHRRPIRIGQAAGQAATKKGWTPLLELTAAISSESWHL